MKKLSFLLNLLLIGVLLISCSGSSEVEEIGRWSDNIHLSQKNVNFGTNGGTATITSQGNWWLNDISLDNISYDTKSLNKFSKSFLFENNDIRVEKIDDKTLLIKTNTNSTNKQRIFIIEIQSGDYFDRIYITQD